MDEWLLGLAACPWGAHAGLSPWAELYHPAEAGGRNAPHTIRTSAAARRPLYTTAERLRRDTSPWTKVQAILAPLQFTICVISLALIIRYLTTGRGYELATGSILLKTTLLYAIMVTGSIWEKDVFGRWLFAPAFFWEDMVSMVVLTLQTTYVAALLTGWGSPGEQMIIAIAAYVAYIVNASQFLIKLRVARLEKSAPHHVMAA